MADKTIILTKNLPSQSDVIQIVLGDNLTYKVHFVIDRYWGDVDLNSLVWSVNMKTANGEKYTDTLTKLAHDDQYITLSWNITGAATSSMGNTFYTVEGKTSAENSPVWRSPAQQVRVLNAVDLGDIYEGADISAVEQLMLEIREYVDDLVIVSETEPESENNKIWFDPNFDDEVIVPTMDDMANTVNGVFSVSGNTLMISEVE